MNEKERRAEAGVSRETSEPEIGAPAKPSSGLAGSGGVRERAELSPQAEAEPSGLYPDEITPEQQMLYDIMDRSIAKKQKEPTGEDPENPAPPREVPEQKQQDSPPPPQKNKPSSFYVYLAVLFGAAFLMLLLAYFVQQRNADATKDDLLLATASKEELVAQIQELEKERDQLQTDLRGQKRLTTNAEERNKFLEQSKQGTEERLMQVTSWLDQSNLLNCLERANDTGDYLLMGVMVQDIDVLFNRLHPNFGNIYLLPAQEARYLELREELFQKGGVMVMEGRQSEADGSDYVELPKVGEGIYEEEVIDTARCLGIILRDYAIGPEYAAALICKEFQPGGDGAEILHSGAFKKSTPAWLEEVKADLIARKLLEEKDGVLIFTATVSFDEDIIDPTKIKLP